MRPSVPLLLIASAGIILLWGRSLQNGTTALLTTSATTGFLPSKTPLRTVYTGVPVFDFIFATLVGFFYDITRDAPAHKMLLLEAFTAFVPLYLVMSIEANRAGMKWATFWVSYPSVWGALSQGFGAGIAQPIYYIFHLSHQPLSTASPHALSVPVEYAATLIPSVALGALLPLWLVLAPFERSDDTHQVLVAVWQCFPFLISTANRVLSSAVRVVRGGGGATVQRRDEELPYLRAAYGFAFLVAAAGHLYSWSSLLFFQAGSLPMSFSEVYIPDPATVVDLKTGVWCFLQYDWMCIASSMLVWAAYSVKPLTTVAWVPLVMMNLVGAATVGPAATTALAFWWREERIRDSGNVKRA